MEKNTCSGKVGWQPKITYSPLPKILSILLGVFLWRITFDTDAMTGSTVTTIDIRGWDSVPCRNYTHRLL